MNPQINGKTIKLFLSLSIQEKTTKLPIFGKEGKTKKKASKQKNNPQNKTNKKCSLFTLLQEPSTYLELIPFRILCVP